LSWMPPSLKWGRDIKKEKKRKFNKIEFQLNDKQKKKKRRNIINKQK